MPISPCIHILYIPCCLYNMSDNKLLRFLNFKIYMENCNILLSRFESCPLLSIFTGNGRGPNFLSQNVSQMMSCDLDQDKMYFLT